MFDLGIQELIVIFIVALLVFGPKRLPELGRTLGKGMAELRKALHGVKEQMDAEMNEIKEPLKQDSEIYKRLQEIDREAKELKKELHDKTKII
jgi:Tat protein translocase TatB subunit